MNTTFVDNPVNESSPCMIQKEETSHAKTQNHCLDASRSRHDDLFLGDTYLTTGLSVACAAVALPMSIYLTFRWLEGSHDFLP